MMKRWILAALVAAAVAQASACGGKKKDAAKDGTGKTAASTDTGKPALPPGPPPPAPHADVTSALWAFAPADAIFGVVLGDGVPAKLRASARAILDDVGERPFGKHLHAALEMGRQELGFDPLDAAGWKSMGIDDAKGAAVFISLGALPRKTAKEKEDNAHTLMILPVVDRVAFRTKVKAKTETVDGKEYDRLADDLLCAPVGERYFCAKNAADLARAGTPHDGKLAAAVKAMPAESRGDFELYGDLAGIPDAADELARLAPFGKIEAAGITMRLEPDGLLLRGWSKGAPDGPIGQALRSQPPRADFAGKSGASATLVRLSMANPKILFAEVDEHMPVGGVDLRTDLVDQLTGELQLLSAGKGLVAGVIMVGIADAAKVTGAIKSVCAVGKTSIGRPRMPIKSLDLNDAGCKGTLDFADVVPGLTLPVLPFDLKVDGKQIVATIGDVDPARLAGNAADDAGSFETHAMLAGPSTFVSWSRSLDLDYDGMPPEVLAQMKKNEPLVLMDATSWFSTAVYEIGTVGTVDATGATLVVRVTTFAGDPPEARAAYIEAIKKRHDLDRTGYTAALVELARKYPATKAGKRAKLESEGTPLLGPGSALLGAGAAAFIVQEMHGGPKAGNEPPSDFVKGMAPDDHKPGFGGHGKKKEEAAPSELKAPPSAELKSPPGTP
jgi:hypothetical protein